MAEISKNARVNVVVEKFFCGCGGEVKMKSVFTQGRMKTLAECTKCNRTGRRPGDLKS
jgi:hypothetical protein